MKSILTLLVLAVCVMFLTSPGTAQDKSANKYVGAKMCGACHKKPTGDQFGIWQKTKHSEAYKNLQTKAADEVAKKKGLKTAAAESPECLECHAVNAAMKEDGVGCEACHGAGSSYKAMSTMKDHGKAVAAGLTDFKDAASMEKTCKKCHNEKSPTFKGFDFKTMWAKIQHPRPKKS
jgi:hypothetical protein